MSDPLNFFEPFEQLAARHENQLTRAFLVVLRHSPLAHQAWLQLVAPEHALHRLGRATFRTQQGRILDAGARVVEERLHGISVIQAADVPAISGDVKDSDRRAIYDGIVTYGDDLVIVIENKLDGPVSDRQAREINRHDANIEFDPQPRPVSWRAVLDAFSDLVDADLALVAGAEKAVIEDFLEFCQRHFPALLPFSSLRRCAGDPRRIRRRLGAIASSIAPDPQDAEGHKLMLPGRRVVDRAYVDVSGTETEAAAKISVWMFPADTLGQARGLWASPEKVAGLRALASDGWDTQPNMHFSYRGTGLVSSRGPMEPEAYMNYWEQHIGQTGALRPEDWAAYWDRLADAGIVHPEDRSEFDARFTNTQRHNAVPCPGVICGKGWARTEAESADDDGRLSSMVRETINEMLRALGEPELRSP